MCYHSSKSFVLDEIEQLYGIHVTDEMLSNWEPLFHENGFDHAISVNILPNKQSGMFSWGLIPWYTKGIDQAKLSQNQCLNAISEEMFDKASFRDSLKDEKRCLIPMTNFFEWQWMDSKGKEKQPYCIGVSGQKIFSVAGIYSTWKNPTDGKMVYTYAVLTTKGNKLMEEIHNNKKRMPVIIPREYENDWLREGLTKDDVLALCQPFDTNKMDAYPITKRITSKKDPTNVPEVLQRAEKTTLF